jgi:hypothetical protein
MDADNENQRLQLVRETGITFWWVDARSDKAADGTDD